MTRGEAIKRAAATHNGQPTPEQHTWTEWTCDICHVSWRARDDERLPDVCWNCETADRTRVMSQCGRPVKYFAGEVGQ